MKFSVIGPEQTPSMPPNVCLSTLEELNDYVRTVEQAYEGSIIAFVSFSPEPVIYVSRVRVKAND